jgi:hypothetical protein
VGFTRIPYAGFVSIPVVEFARIPVVGFARIPYAECARIPYAHTGTSGKSHQERQGLLAKSTTLNNARTPTSGEVHYVEVHYVGE